VARRFLVVGVLVAAGIVAAAASLLATRGDGSPAPPPGGGSGSISTQPPPGDGSSSISTQRLLGHLRALERLADENGGTRASGTAGYDASVRYVVAELREAGYEPTFQRFEFPFFIETAPPRVDVVEPRGVGELPGEAVTIGYSASGDVRGRVVPVDVRIPPAEPNSTSSACESSDFEGFPRGAVALVQRGGCFFYVKAKNAEEAGASAVALFNEGQPGRRDALRATLGRPGIALPVVGIAYEAGRRLADLARGGRAVVHVATRTESGRREAANVLAELPGRDDEIVLLGAHLDSVTRGPGINDNGTGVAAVLEIARETRRAAGRPARTVVFAFWAAEELGLYGSREYVRRLGGSAEDRVAAVVNLDMLGSRNAVRFVYDGDGSESGNPGPEGSGTIERLYLDHFRRRSLEVETVPVDLPSDQVPFLQSGVAVGGVFSGADEAKSAEQARTFGGSAGEPLDPCYHRACDTTDGIDARTLTELAQASAAVVARLARGGA
jgi:Zn-dependent M28 family amino/carboxypeptidase